MLSQVEKVIYENGKCNLQTIVYSDNGIDRCQYSGQTVPEYLKEHPNTVCISFDEALKKIHEEEEKIFITAWKEITEEEWMDALECLPPEKWETVSGVELFRMSEYTTGNITAHYARLNNKYYYSGRRTSNSYEKLAEEIKKLAPQ